jgi:hypothetical protein
MVTPEGLSGLEVDDQLGFVVLLYGQIARLFTLENAASIAAHQAGPIGAATP